MEDEAERVRMSEDKRGPVGSVRMIEDGWG